MDGVLLPEPFEHLAEERPLLLRLALVVIPAMFGLPAMVGLPVSGLPVFGFPAFGLAAVVVILGFEAVGGGHELVELTAVQPDPTALRAVVDLDAPTFGQGERFTIQGAIHEGSG
jgi:hypothetical protein